MNVSFSFANLNSISPANLSMSCTPSGTLYFSDKALPKSTNVFMLGTNFTLNIFHLKLKNARVL